MRIGAGKKEKKMEKNTNLSWGKLTAASLSAAKFWLRFIAGVWMGATHGSEEVEAVYRGVLAAVDEINPHDPGEVPRVYSAFKALAEGLIALDRSNPVSLVCKIEDGGKLRLGWDGAWTGGRYLYVSYEPYNHPTVFVEWDTGTGKESTFLSLPSTAEQFAAGEKAKICPLANHYRVACEALGLDVSDIPERGYRGVREAQQALDDLVKSAVQAAKQKVRQDGGACWGK
jgi:hypothetical protein